MHPEFRNASIAVFKKHSLKDVLLDLHPVYNICKPIDLKLLTRLRPGLNHLSEDRFNHNSENCVNPLCTCSLEAETTSHFFLHCHFYYHRLTLFNELCEIDMNLPNILRKDVSVPLFFRYMRNCNFALFQDLAYFYRLKIISHDIPKIK